MKKMITALVAAIAMSGCTVNVGEDSSPNKDTATSEYSTQDQNYLDTLSEELPQFENGDSDTLISAGKNVCSYFDEFGVSLTTLGILSQQFSDTFTTEETATILIVSMDAYCPDTKAEVLALNGGNV